MYAYYNKIEAPIDEEKGMRLYVVYYETIRGDGYSTHSIYKMIGVYDSEDTAKAVVNAFEKGLIC